MSETAIIEKLYGTLENRQKTHLRTSNYSLPGNHPMVISNKEEMQADPEIEKVHIILEP